MSDSANDTISQLIEAANGEPLAMVAFRFDPRQGVQVERKGGFPRHILVRTLEEEKAASLQMPVEVASTSASVKITWHPKKGVEVTREGSFPEDMLTMALAMEIHAVIAQTFTECMMREAVQQQGRVLLADGTMPPPGLRGG